MGPRRRYPGSPAHPTRVALPADALTGTHPWALVAGVKRFVPRPGSSSRRSLRSHPRPPRVTNESGTVPRCPESMRFQRVPSHRSLLLSTEDVRPAMRDIVMPLVFGVRGRIGRMDDCHRGSRFLDHGACQRRGSSSSAVSNTHSSDRSANVRMSGPSFRLLRPNAATEVAFRPRFRSSVPIRGDKLSSTTTSSTNYAAARYESTDSSQETASSI